jgi:oligoendopeptidase F
MNYDKTFNSILTAAHEIGHSINSYFIAKNQKIYCDTSIFYAEIPSITNEILLILFLLKKYKNNKDLKIMLFDNILSTFFSSTIVQIVFSNFEFIISE